MEDARIIEIATRLFAELGYDATSMGLIAKAAGLDAAALAERTGGKPKLYLAVMERASRLEKEAMREAVASFTPTVRGLLDLTDAYLDFHAANPWVQWLWVHRWLGDAADTVTLEESHRRPLTLMLVDTVRDLIPADVDVDYLLWTIAWAVAGFFTGGLPRSDARARTGPFRPDEGGDVTSEDLEEFRSYLHALVRRMTSPAPSG